MTPLEQAAKFLPVGLRTPLLSEVKDCEEIHLRTGQLLTISDETGQERPLSKKISVTTEDIRTVIELSTCVSYHRMAERLAQGFIPLCGGHRLGISGMVTSCQGKITAIQPVSSLCLRVAHSVQGFADDVGRAVFEGEVQSTLILSPPCMGKTTLLRELIRLGADRYHKRIGLADERGEVAALWNGIPQLNVGSSTDILDGCPKAEGLLLLLRGMSPQVLAADEITAPQDIQALSMAANCGVPVLATAHGKDLKELTSRTLYKKLLEERIFRRVILITRQNGQRLFQVERL